MELLNYVEQFIQYIENVISKSQMISIGYIFLESFPFIRTPRYTL